VRWKGRLRASKRLEGDDGPGIGDARNGLHLFRYKMADIGCGIDVEFYQKIEIAGGRVDFRGNFRVGKLVGDLIGLAELAFNLHEKGDHGRLRIGRIAYIIRQMHAPVEFADIAADVFARIKSRAPRVHCITNTVAQAYTANILLAAGAIPSMTISQEEIGAFVGSADALLVNLGTFDAERRAAIDLAIGPAAQAGKPWVLDPVFIERSPARAQFARGLVARGPAVVRLNQREFDTLSGIDAKAFDAKAFDAKAFARQHKTIVALTGENDVVTDGERSAKISNGDPLMSLVTAMGCAGSALVCAALSVERDPWIATIAALVALGVTGEVAAKSAPAPGRFASWIIDALYNLDRATLRAHAKVS
jgi:hydroxyethylthiazole kinase